MKKHERLTAILELLAQDDVVDVDDAAKRLGVSAATIRRDLDQLAEQHLLTRTHGGAVSSNSSFDLPLRFKSGRQASEKERIGRAAAALVEPGFVVGINGGTTNTEVARALAARADSLAAEGKGSSAGPVPLTVVTNSLNIAYELTVRPHVKLVVTGGVARSRSYELTGPLASGVLEQLTFDVAIIGVDAVDPVLGATAHHEGEAMTNQLMAGRARRVVVVADSTKLGRHAFARIWPTARIDVLVTDAAADPALTERFTALGVQVVTG
ncbi:DeoR/GlpR family DNA-binding transcription regulator [Streptacidiphilus cavernicola]|uniref:DeoR/GlpR family DNA-binding transcription regulator n=1 Tax=Streptacidiphilus cavernicola TaxID=3342716 RepID=A0ABV6VN98_9ACTN